MKQVKEKYDVKAATKPQMKKVETEKDPKWKKQHEDLQQAMK